MNITQTGPVAGSMPTNANAANRTELATAQKELQAALKGTEKVSTSSTSNLRTEKEREKRLDEQETQSLTEAANNELASLTTALSFSVDKDINRFVVKLIDVNSRETLRQYPAEEMLEVYKALKRVTSLMMPEQASAGSNPNKDMSSGILLSSKA